MTNKYIISYPRSGQHLIEKFLNFYCQQKNIPYSYCEFYSCCRNIPCKKGKIFQKNHDLSLDINIEENSKYLVLYRSNFLEQMEAEYRVFRYTMNNIELPKEINYSDTEKLRLHTHIRKHRNRYFGFIEKWVLNLNSNILKIDYNQLLIDNSLLKNIIHFFFEDSDTEDVIKSFLSVEPIEKKHNIINCWI